MAAAAVAVAEDATGQHAVRHLVTDEERVALLAGLLVRLQVGVAGQEVGRELVSLAHLATTTVLQVHRLQLLVDPVVGLELPDLKRYSVAGCVADGAEVDLRVLDVVSALQDSQELGQLAVHDLRRTDVRAGHVQHHGQRGRVGVLVADDDFPHDLAGELAGGAGDRRRVEQAVHRRCRPAGVDVVIVVEGWAASRDLCGVTRAVGADTPTSSTHGGSPPRGLSLALLASRTG